jgi:hypothetical protein
MTPEQDNTKAITEGDDYDEDLIQSEDAGDSQGPEAPKGKAAAKSAQKEKDEGPGCYGWGSAYGMINRISWKLHL